MRLVLLCMLAALPAMAEELLDPDTEVARRHFDSGTVLYDDYKYAEAIVEFKAANEAKPHPDFDYNIARCYDRLGDWGNALAYYQRYLGGTGDLSAAAEVKERIASLQDRIARAVVPAPALPPLPPRPRRLRLAALVLAGVTVAGIAAGGGFYGWAAEDFPSRRSYCRSLPRECVPSEFSDLQARANAAYALWGVSSALAVIDVVLFVVDAVRQRRSLHASAHGFSVSF